MFEELNGFSSFLISMSRLFAIWSASSTSFLFCFFEKVFLRQLVSFGGSAWYKCAVPAVLITSKRVSAQHCFVWNCNV